MFFSYYWIVLVVEPEDSMDVDYDFVTFLGHLGGSRWSELGILRSADQFTSLYEISAALRLEIGW